MIHLNKSEIELATKFATTVTETTFDIYKGRNENLTVERAIENALRGKLGEIAVYKFLTENSMVISPVDFEVSDNKKHGADLTVIGKNINVHIKTCRNAFHSWIFERTAQYVCKPTPSDYICLVAQCNVDRYKIVAMRHSSEFKFEPTIKPMRTKLAIYL